jgi:hypothetical protein
MPLKTILDADVQERRAKNDLAVDGGQCVRTRKQEGRASTEGTVIPFAKADIGVAEVSAVMQVLESGWLTSGDWRPLSLATWEG